MLFSLKPKSVKIISLTLLTIFASEILLPTVALAITSGNTQPEVFDFQPVDATDNVSMSSGAFNYTIPITSIPEYPMAISYRSGVKADQEAGMFGYGFHGFPGAIGRNMVGLPDDIKGAEKKYRFENDLRWYVSVTASLSAPIFKSIFKNIANVNASVNVTGGYDSYTGIFGSVGLGLSVRRGLGIGGPVGIFGSAGLSMNNDSRSLGLTYGSYLSASVGINKTLKAKKSSAEINYSLMDLGKDFSAFGNTDSDFGNGTFSSSNNGANHFLSPLANVASKSSGFGISLTVTIPISVMSLSITGRYGQNKIERSIDAKAYGFNYLRDVDRRELNSINISDMSIEGENPYPTKDELKDGKSDPRTFPSYLQRDYFMVNAMGISGNMQLNQKEYGVVSRNYTRTQHRDIDINSISLKTTRNEVYPWTSVNQARINREIDIIKFLKKSDPNDRDFDQVLFVEKERASLTSEDYKFGKAEFKMRGDYAGEYNLASKSDNDQPDFRDREPNEFTLDKVANTGDGGFVFLGHEKDMPLYVPKPSSSTSDKFQQSNLKLEKSTDIKYFTIGEVLSRFQDKLNDGSSSDINEKNKFLQSFYSHYAYQPSDEERNNKAANVSFNESNTGSFNILNHLKQLAGGDAYAKALIGWLEVKNTSGMKYIFNLPAFAKKSQSLHLKGKGIKPPVLNSGKNDYYSFSTNERNKLAVTDDYVYPYAWLLTAVVGEDYIDFDNIPGPSDGDIGFWVKFKYIKAADDYRWRSPFTGLEHIEGILFTSADDMYGMSTGLKEIYYVSEIESSDYICKYNYQKRYDGLDAKVKANGEAINTLRTPKKVFTEDMTGKNFQFAVTQIDLYKKNFSGDRSKQIKKSTNSNGKIIRSTKFEYDYSLCPNVPNNLTIYNGYKNINKGSLPYYYNRNLDPTGPIGTGKMTLRKVQDIAYDEQGTQTLLPSFNFNYNGDSLSEKDKYNPSYDSDMTDQWGNYSTNTKSKGKFLTNVNYYNHFCEYDPSVADDNSKVYHLKEIILPTGGKMEVEYKAQTYGYVQDKKPYDMRRVLASGLQKVENGTNSNTSVKIDVNDIYVDELKSGVSSPKGIKNCLNAGDTLYGEIAFYREPKNVSSTEGEDKLFLASTKAKVVSIANPELINGKWFQSIELASIKEKDGPNKIGKAPFFYEVTLYMYTESDQMRAIKENVVPSCSNIQSSLDNYEKMEKDKAADAIRKVIANFTSVFTPSSEFEDIFEACYGEPGKEFTGIPGSDFYESLSFIRTPIYKAKYTGTRVHSIKYSDQFNYATNPSSPENAIALSGISGNVYFFDENTDGTGRSSGVATIEPGGGESCVIDASKLEGTGFVPSPSIISAKTAMTPYYHDTDESDNVRSRYKGKTIYEFYTPKDEGLQPMKYFKSISPKEKPMNPKGHYYLFGIWSFLVIKFKIFGRRIKIKIPFVLPLTLKWDRSDYYHKKSYSYTDFSDIYGRMKAVRQVNAAGQEEASQVYHYFDNDSGVPVYKNSYEASALSKFRPGKVDQAWSEAYFTKESDIKLIPPVFMFAKTERHFAFTSVKYSYVPPVLQKVVSTVDGVTTITENTGFDYYTGEAIEARSNDSYKNTKIKRTVPAYWKYSGMGPSWENPNNTNMLTQPTANYLYLNQCDNNHVLGASVTSWSSDKWSVLDYLQPRKDVVDNDNYRYTYKQIPGNTLKSAYYASNTSEFTAHNTALYRPYETYTYEVDLKSDGTFNTFIPFNYNGTIDAQWKKLNTNELFNAKGVVVQTKDILGKYTSQQIANGNQAIGSVTNSSYGASVFEGAENFYYSNNLQRFILEGNRIQLKDANLVETSNSVASQSFVLNTESYLQLNSSSVKLIRIDKPANPTQNKSIAKITVNFSNNVSRNISIVPNGNNYSMVTDRGEAFDGFVLVPNTLSSSKDFILLDWSKITSISIVDGSILTGYSVAIENSYNMDGVFNCASLPNKVYRMPAANNIAESHTGKYAFALNPGKTGTEFMLSSATVNADDFKRKYKALVWVHTSSPASTELVAQIFSNGTVNEIKTSLSAPYQKAGNWNLLRIDFDLSNLNYNTNTTLSDMVMVFVRNSSTSGVSVYDDFRVLPYQATMVNTIYDPIFNRVDATLDADNFATFNKYDSRGRVIETIVEIENKGRETVKKYLYNDQKKAN